MLTFAGLAMLAMLAVVVVVVSSWSGAAQSPPPLRAVPAPPPEVAGTEPDPAEAAPIPQVEVRSTPSGAEVWEGNSRLCAATPCMVDHPDHAPVPRVFELRLPGHQRTRVDMTELGQPVDATLPEASREPPPPRPRPRVAPRPVPEPPVPNAGTIMDER